MRCLDKIERRHNTQPSKPETIYSYGDLDFKVLNVLSMIFCLEKKNHYQKSPNSKGPIKKKVFKTASLQFKGGALPNVVQTAKAAKRKPTKTKQLQRIKLKAPL